MATVELELPLPVSENRYRRWIPNKNHPIICREGREYHHTVARIFNDSEQSPLVGKIRATVEFYPPDNRKRDLDNLFKCLFDSLCHASIIQDDSDIFELFAYKREVIPGGLVYVKLETIG